MNQLISQVIQAVSGIQVSFQLTITDGLVFLRLDGEFSRNQYKP